MLPSKAMGNDMPGRFREIISDPLNILVERVPMAGAVRGDDVHQPWAPLPHKSAIYRAFNRILNILIISIERARTVRRVLRGSEIEVCLHNGNWVPLSGEACYYGAFSQILVINRGVHEPLEEYVFQELLKHLPVLPTMVELGAYWGHYSMWLQKARPQSKVILVEPSKTFLAAGRDNFRRNGFEGEFINATVERGAFEVDQFLDNRKMPHLDILHSDIQGFELQMLEGAVGALSGAKIDYLFISTHSQQIHTEVICTLKKNAYRVEVSSDFENETTSFDGFVFASSPLVVPIFQSFRPIGRTQIVGSDPDGLIKYLVDQRGSA